MSDILLSFFQLVGVVSLVAFVAVLCAVAIAAAYNTRPKPMIMRGEFRCYVNRRRLSHERC